MERRKFIKIVTGGAAGLAASQVFPPLLAQTGGVQGVQGNEIKIGMSAAFTGANAGLGVELYRGAQAVYEEVNASGGVHGRRLSVVALDDQYDPLKCVNNTIELLEKEKVFFLSNYVGTPTLAKALPIIKRSEAAKLCLVGNFTGAQTQREFPFESLVFNIRSSYRQEMAATVENLWNLGIRKFGVFYQIDSYGRSGTDGVIRALAAKGAKIAAEATYSRGTSFDEDMSAAVEHLRKAGVEAVLSTGAYQGCGAFIRHARDAGWKALISNVSFVGSNAMLALLLEQGQKTGKDYSKNLINSQVVPGYEETKLPGVAEYRRLMEKWSPQVPPRLKDPKYVTEPYSFVGLEGFVNAKVIVEALNRAGQDLDRQKLFASLEALSNYDLGIGPLVSFGPGHHQGLDAVFFTTVEGTRWVPVSDWKIVIRS